jgi:flagellar protein FliO/FliZ
MEWELYLRSVGALVAVLALIAGVAQLARRFGAIGTPLAMRRKRRLILLESLPLDNRRRLVLVRRDQTEHLLLIGGMADIVVERGLGNGASLTEPVA